jgi:hypothetical protein
MLLTDYSSFTGSVYVCDKPLEIVVRTLLHTYATYVCHMSIYRTKLGYLT